MRPYYSLWEDAQRAEISIYGDITTAQAMETDAVAGDLAEEIRAVTAPEIHVYINSYGGEAAAALAIYNALTRHKANIVTYCDGFACSAASVVFMAGDRRVMYDASLLMIHNVWTVAEGNAQALRKQAEDLEAVNQASVQIYAARTGISQEKIRRMMDEETWISPEEALLWGFATEIARPKREEYAQSARRLVCQKLTAKDEEATAERIARKVVLLLGRQGNMELCTGERTGDPVSEPEKREEPENTEKSQGTEGGQPAKAVPQKAKAALSEAGLLEEAGLRQEEASAGTGLCEEKSGAEVALCEGKSGMEAASLEEAPLEKSGAKAALAEGELEKRALPEKEPLSGEAGLKAAGSEAPPFVDDLAWKEFFPYKAASAGEPVGQKENPLARFFHMGEWKP
nr:MAG TPA: Putative ATP dependent Clp protease [Caudoviricetes sp.]